MKADLGRILTWVCEPVKAPPPRLLIILFGLMFIFDRDLYALATSNVIAGVAVVLTPLIAVRLTYVWIKYREDKDDG